VVGIVGLLTSAYHWFYIQNALTSDPVLALTSTIFLVMTPPAVTAFLFPWSPGAALLQKVNARTWGYALIVICAMFLLYYAWTVQWAWWSAQPQVTSAGLVAQQVLLHLVGTIFVPALVIAPVSGRDLARQIREQRQVEEYEIQLASRKAALAAGAHRVESLMLRGIANLTADEKHELATGMRSLVMGMDKTLAEIGDSVKQASGLSIPVAQLQQRPEIAEFFEDLEQQLALPPGTIKDAAQDMADRPTDRPTDRPFPAPRRRQS
jgi:signal transduction histidine kinase